MGIATGVPLIAAHPAVRDESAEVGHYRSPAAKPTAVWVIEVVLLYFTFRQTIVLTTIRPFIAKGPG